MAGHLVLVLHRARGPTPMFEEHFAPTDVPVEANGNVLAAVAFLEGLASHELREDELLAYDDAYPVFVAIRAVKGDR